MLGLFAFYGKHWLMMMPPPLREAVGGFDLVFLRSATGQTRGLSLSFVSREAHTQHTRASYGTRKPGQEPVIPRMAPIVGR